MDGPTEGPTDGPTNRPSYRDAWMHLNKFVRTKMFPEEGTKIELQREIGQILSDLQV